MKWTTEKPTESGWYWLDEGYGKHIIYLYEAAFGLDVSVAGNECTQPISEYPEGLKWSGPIPEPEDD